MKFDVGEWRRRRRWDCRRKLKVMVAGFEGGGDSGPGGKGAQRETVGDALRRDKDIGIDAVMLDGKHLAGAGKAGLHLIGNKEDAVLVEDFLYLFEIVWRRTDDAAFAHDWFGDERRLHRREV